MHANTRLLVCGQTVKHILVRFGKFNVHPYVRVPGTRAQASSHYRETFAPVILRLNFTSASLSTVPSCQNAGYVSSRVTMLTSV